MSGTPFVEVVSFSHKPRAIAMSGAKSSESIAVNDIASGEGYVPSPMPRDFRASSATTIVDSSGTESMLASDVGVVGIAALVDVDRGLRSFNRFFAFCW